MENRLDELASILDWVDDRALAPKWRLPAWYIRYDGNGLKSRSGARNLDTLRTRLSDCLVRRVRAEVLSQLPKRRDTRVPVVMTPEQRDEHDALNDSIAKLASIAERRALRQEEFLRLMQLLTTQRMIANGLGQIRFDELWPAINGRMPSPALLDSLFAPKLHEFRRLVESLVVDRQRKIVVFSQWRRMLRLADWSVRDLLSPRGHRALFFTGAESAKLRTQSIVEFHDCRLVRDHGQVAAPRGEINDPELTPRLRVQARYHRTGSKRKRSDKRCSIKSLIIARGSVDACGIPACNGRRRAPLDSARYRLRAISASRTGYSCSAV